MRGTIVVSGALAQRPGVGGHTWVFLQYMLGFRALGWDVLFVDELAPELCISANGRPCDPERSVNARYLAAVMSEFGFGDSWALLVDAQAIGVSREEVLKRTDSAPFLLNVMGYLKDDEVLDAVPSRVFLDIDPGFGQMWRDLELADIFAGHDDHVSIGENIGHPECAVPTCGIDWITTPQPVALDHWPAQINGGGAFTSVGSWRGPFAPVEYAGKTYGLRVHEFRKFTEVPAATREHFEIALKIDEADAPDVERLHAGGWSLLDPAAIARDPATYRAFVQRSKAEFMVAKNMYVEARSGWFSDRSICYLASGKPVLAQDTGLDRLYPLGEGLIAFSTPEEAVAGVAEIVGDYPRHARAARALAEEHFDARKVCARLLEKLGVD